MYKTGPKLNRSFCRKIVSLWLVMWLITPGWAFALPSDGNVVGGDGSITTAPSGLEMTIEQTSSKLAIDWQSFNIQAGESVHFDQPDVNSIVLNRVIGVDPSKIYGNLSATGQVFLSNPSGVVFGKGSVVDVHGLLATSLTINKDDFMDGIYKFSQGQSLVAVLSEGNTLSEGRSLARALSEDYMFPKGSSLKAVINDGTINAKSYVGLVAPAVQNSGSIIVADMGSVVLASGTAATVDFNGDGLINFAVTKEVSDDVYDPNDKSRKLKDRILNSGTIRANGGRGFLTARSAGKLIGDVVNHSGLIEAQTVQQKDGKIILSSRGEGNIGLSGTLDAPKVVVRGDTVSVAAKESLSTNNGRIKIVANDLDLKGELNSGEGDVVFKLANGGDLNLTPGNGKGSLGGNDIGNIIAKNLILRTQGNINVKGIFKDDTAGIKNSVIMRSHKDITFEDVASTFPALRLRANNDVNVNADVTTTQGNIRVLANDLNLNADLKSGGNKVVFTRRNGQDLTLASNDAVGTLSGDDLSHIVANNLVLRTRGNINVEGITENDTAGITNSVILKSGKNITFDGESSTFPALDLRAITDINVNTDVTTTKGDFIAKADSENNGVGDFNVAPGVTITSARDIDVTAPTINADDDTSFDETRDLILNGDVAGSQPPINPVIAESIQQGYLGSFLTEFLENGGSDGC